MFVHQEQLGPTEVPTKFPVAKSVVLVCDLSQMVFFLVQFPSPSLTWNPKMSWESKGTKALLRPN